MKKLVYLFLCTLVLSNIFVLFGGCSDERETFLTTNHISKYTVGDEVDSLDSFLIDSVVDSVVDSMDTLGCNQTIPDTIPSGDSKNDVITDGSSYGGFQIYGIWYIGNVTFSRTVTTNGEYLDNWNFDYYPEDNKAYSWSMDSFDFEFTKISSPYFVGSVNFHYIYKPSMTYSITISGKIGDDFVAF